MVDADTRLEEFRQKKERGEYSSIQKTWSTGKQVF